ncbi:hypothetical protein LVY72_05135 [Arthrobacter sp. I2-34]|uniref:Uncharacterized protein n=1 Tax=Arthrobacter hankyongi TaxID=2904801 RepID=A0ABS9L3T2_9MICC|nr:hypothetical protein [Arthrobacter hankyongi]MCG2621296.1 hypothetical protein [Arthrobacter hankyongi]
MLTKETNFNPTGIDPIDELPLAQPPEEDLWAENFCYQAWDREQDLGVWVHIARMPYDKSIWRETVIVFLPDNRYFLSRAFARGAHEAGPGSAGIKLSCIEPFRRFRLQFDGVGRYVTQADVEDGALRDGLAQPFQLDLQFDAAAPLWDMSAHLKNQHFATMHHEQTCLATGTIHARGETFIMEKAGAMRDHSRGPRDFSKLNSHIWFNAVFPSGKSFNVLANYERKTGNSIARGFVSDGTTFHDFAMEPSFLKDPDKPFEIENLKLSNAESTFEIGIEVLRVLPMAMRIPNDLVLGKEAAGDGRGNRLYEGRARYTWDGEEAYGHIERSCPLVPEA